MNCSEIKELLYEYQTDNLDDATKEQVDAHLKTCPTCQKVLEELKIDLKLLEYARPPKVSADFKDRVMQSIKPSVIPFYRRSAFKYVLQGTVAAMLIFGLVSVLKLNSPTRNTAPTVRGEGKTSPITDACKQAVGLYNKGTTTADFGAKEQLFNDALACNCTDRKIQAKIFNNLADCCEHQGRLDEAVKTYNTAISLDKDLYPAYIGLGDISKRKSNMPDAIMYYEKALKIMGTGASGAVTPAELETINKEIADLKKQNNR